MDKVLLHADKRDSKEIEKKNHMEMKIYPLSWRSTYSVVGGGTPGSDIPKISRQKARSLTLN